MMSMAKAGRAMSGMMLISPAGDCKGCSQDGASMKAAGCIAACAALTAIALEPVAVGEVSPPMAWYWTSDTHSSHDTAPDPSPPRS